jgi:hypothetical protein
MLLASQAKDPGQESSYRFCMAALGGVSGDLLCSRSREFRLSMIHDEVLGPSPSYATPKKHRGRGASHSGLFCTGLLCGTLRGLLHIGGGSLGEIGNTAPSSSDVIPMGSKMFALQAGHRVRVSSAKFVFDVC